MIGKKIVQYAVMPRKRIYIIISVTTVAFLVV